MRTTLFYFILIIGLTSKVKARNFLCFQYGDSTVLIQGKLINCSFSGNQFDSGIQEGTCDILIEKICTRDTKTELYFKVGDTIKRTKIRIEDPNVLELTDQSFIFSDFPISKKLLSNKGTQIDFTTTPTKPCKTNDFEINCDLQKKITKNKKSDTLFLNQKYRRHKTITYFPNGKKHLKYVRIIKSKKMNVVKVIEWDENGKKQSRKKKKSYPYDKGSRTIVWVFRENGEICFYRGIQILK